MMETKVVKKRRAEPAPVLAAVPSPASAAPVPSPATPVAPGTPGFDDSTKAPAGGTEANRRVMKAIVIGPVLKEDLTTGKPKELPEDDALETLASEGRVIQPPFELLVLSMLPEHSTELRQCIEAMEVNIAGFGYRLKSRVKVDDPDCPPELKKAVKDERIWLTNFFNNCCFTESFTKTRRKTRSDMETTGNAFWEVVRNGMGRIDGFVHIPSYQLRLGVQDKDHTEYKRPRLIMEQDGSWALKDVREFRRFRPFVQTKMGSFSRGSATVRGTQVRWFKEFGDPRPRDNESGEVLSEEDAKKLPPDRLASEIIHWSIYTSRSPYGLPRYIGNMITIFGDRAADEVNFVTLKNNNIPSMMVLCANGQLTDATIERIQEYVSTQVQGSDNYSRFIIIEAEGAFESDSPHAKLDVKPLVDQQMRDQMFGTYGKTNSEKLRRCYRLPPIFVGVSDDYTRATAEASRRLADEQVFAPERTNDDEEMNLNVLPAMGVKYHEFVSRGPNITDDEDLINAMGASERVGGMTPRIARQMLSDIMGIDLGEVDPTKLDPDMPLVLQLAEAVKNQAPVMAGSQVTALKSLGLPQTVLEQLLDLRERLTAELDSKTSKPRQAKKRERPER